MRLLLALQRQPVSLLRFIPFLARELRIERGEARERLLEAFAARQLPQTLVPVGEKFFAQGGHLGLIRAERGGVEFFAPENLMVAVQRWTFAFKHAGRVAQVALVPGYLTEHALEVSLRVLPGDPDPEHSVFVQEPGSQGYRPPEGEEWKEAATDKKEASGCVFGHFENAFWAQFSDVPEDIPLAAIPTTLRLKLANGRHPCDLEDCFDGDLDHDLVWLLWRVRALGRCLPATPPAPRTVPVTDFYEHLILPQGAAPSSYRVARGDRPRATLPPGTELDLRAAWTDETTGLMLLLRGKPEWFSAELQTRVAQVRSDLQQGLQGLEGDWGDLDLYLSEVTVCSLPGDRLFRFVEASARLDQAWHSLLIEHGPEIGRAVLLAWADPETGTELVGEAEPLPSVTPIREEEAAQYLSVHGFEVAPHAFTLICDLIHGRADSGRRRGAPLSLCDLVGRRLEQLKVQGEVGYPYYLDARLMAVLTFFTRYEFDRPESGDWGDIHLGRPGEAAGELLTFSVKYGFEPRRGLERERLAFARWVSLQRRGLALAPVSPLPWPGSRL